MNQDGGSRAIPSLDGLRAFSVFAVILGHSDVPYLRYVPFLRNGGEGVAVFFVLSGFLITHLLLKELNRFGDIDLKQFYFRRTFRIFPPFYVFLAAVAILAGFHRVAASPAALLAAATYTWNYVPIPTNWILGHCWSLSLEEQFYLLWPASMAFFSKRTNLRLCAAVILLSPASRVVTYFAWPAMRTHLDMMLHTHLDTIMTGCLLSLVLDRKLVPGLIRRAMDWRAPAAALLFLMAIETPVTLRASSAYRLIAGYSLENLAIAVIVVYSVFQYSSPLGRLLNLRPVRHLGMISYSLYLWQQFYTGPYTRWFPLNVLLIVATAELSYWLVEKPSFLLRDVLGRRLFGARRAALAPRGGGGLGEGGGLGSPMDQERPAPSS